MRSLHAAIVDGYRALVRRLLSAPNTPIDRREDLPHDLLAGIVLGIVTVPQAIAYAYLAGLPAQAGLYACLLPMVIYSVLGSSKQLVVGPVAIAALMVAATIGGYAGPRSDAYGDVVAVLCIEVGLFLWLLRLVQLGGIVNLLSHPVVSGFVNAAAMLIVISQLPAFTGIDLAVAEGGAAFDQLLALMHGLAGLDGTTLALALGSLLLLVLVGRFAAVLVGVNATHPIGKCGPVLVAIGATVAVELLELDTATVGFVPAGLPTLAFPTLPATLWWDLAPNALLIALVAYVESYTVGATLATRRKERLDANRELVALGAANFGAAVTGAYPVAGSFTRSSVNVTAGGRTSLSILTCAVLVVATLLWLTPAFSSLPHAALAAIIMASVWSLVDFGRIREHWHFYRPDVVTHFATLFGVLLAGVEAGLLIGVGTSIALFMRGSSRPHIAVLGRLGDSTHFRNVERFDTRTVPGLTVARVDESLYFANASQVEGRLLALIEPGETAHVVLVMSAVNFIDTTGLEMLARLAERLERIGAELHFSDVKGPVRDQLANIRENWLAERVYRTTDDAVRALS